MQQAEQTQGEFSSSRGGVRVSWRHSRADTSREAGQGAEAEGGASLNIPESPGSKGVGSVNGIIVDITWAGTKSEGQPQIIGSPSALHQISYALG